LCNPETNCVSEKRLPNYIIQKLITNLKKKTFELRNPKYYRRLEYQKFMEVREEHMKVQEETVKVSLKFQIIKKEIEQSKI